MGGDLRQPASRVAIAIASTGRPAMLGEAVAAWRAQDVAPDIILLSVADDADLPAASKVSGAESVIGAKGSTLQRNTAIDALAGRTDLIGFFDDDYLPSRRAVARIAAYFAANPGIVGITGHLLADGVNGAGISQAEAMALIDAYDARPPAEPRIVRRLHGLYGCNMVVRAAAIGGERFDERLRLYGWQEDIDFSARLRDAGVLVKTDAFAGVHLGVKHGRTPGIRFGYSQVVNPVYLWRKGTMRGRYAARMVVKGVVANHLRLVAAEPWLDRAGRARGNWIGLIDCLRGRLTPERVERL